MENQVDNLKKFGSAFQNKCLAGILSDKSFLERILDIVNEDYFENESHKWILRTTLSYFTEYKDLPTLDVFKHKLDAISDVVEKQSIVDNLKNVHTKLHDTDLDYIRETFLEFCQNQTMKSAIMESADLLKEGKYEEIKHTVEEALKAGMERDDGHDYLTEIAERLEDDCRDTVKTNMEVLDEIMDGGLGAGELGVVTACAGSGKSWVLTKLGVEAMRQGKNVVHFTLELGQKYVGRRYDCNFTGIDFQSIVNNKDAVIKALCNIDGFMKIKYYPIKTVSALTLKNYIERIQTLTGKKVDLMVVDYADILRPIHAEKNANSYSEAGGIYEELRGVAGELQIPCWTASQSNRGAAKEDIIEADSISDSYRKIMTADFVMSLSRKMEDKLNNTARIHVIKNRFGPDGLTYNAAFDTSCGSLELYETTSEKGKELQQRLESGEADVRNHLREKWKTMSGDSGPSNELG